MRPGGGGGGGAADRVVAEDGVAEGDEDAAGDRRAPRGVVRQPPILRGLVLVWRAGSENTTGRRQSSMGWVQEGRRERRWER